MNRLFKLHANRESWPTRENLSFSSPILQLARPRKERHFVKCANTYGMFKELDSAFVILTDFKSLCQVTQSSFSRILRKRWNMLKTLRQLARTKLWTYRCRWELLLFYWPSFEDIVHYPQFWEVLYLCDDLEGSHIVLTSVLLFLFELIKLLFNFTACVAYIYLYINYNYISY